MCNAIDRGTTMATMIIAERFVPGDGESLKTKKILYDPIPRSNVTTITDMNKRVI
jgi:hypothetical protein